MDAQFRKQKHAVRQWLKFYSDERLAALLAHAQSGRLAFQSCCCLVGSLTADHPLCGQWVNGDNIKRTHYKEVVKYLWAAHAEIAYRAWGKPEVIVPLDLRDERRRRILIPIIRAQFKLRSRRRIPSHELVSQAY